MTYVVPWQVISSFTILVAFIAFFVGRWSVRKDYQIAITPFCRTETTNWLGKKRVSCEVGYRHQLLVKGLPCLNAAEVVVESHDQKEMKREDLVQLVNDAIRTIEMTVGKGIPVLLRDVVMESLEKKKKQA